MKPAREIAGGGSGPSWALAPEQRAGLLDSLDIILWEGDPETFRFSYVSEQAERITGYPADAWLAPGFWVEHLHPSDRAWASELCMKATRSGEPHSLEYRMIAADGGIVWLRDIVSVELENGRPVRFGGVMVDVSERRRAEEARHAAETQLRTVITKAPVVIFAVSIDGTVTLCEGTALGPVGVDPASLVGHSYLERPPQVRKAIREALAGRLDRCNITLRGRTFDTSFAPIYGENAERRGVIGVGTDITERLKAQEERDRLGAQVRHAQKLESLGVLAGGIAHDFNNLLMSILGNADLALADMRKEAPGRPQVDRIRDAGRRLSGLTQQLLAYSGKGTFVVEPLDLSLLIEEMQHLLAVGVSKKAHHRFELEPDLPAVDGDASQLGQVVMNLVTNAADALGRAGGSIAVRTGVMEADRSYLSRAYVDEDYPEGRYVYLEVEDSGSGMSPETRGRIFDPFFTTKATGQGLGLAVVLGIVRSHHGAICVTSDPGLGTTFRVLLPCSHSAAARPGAPPAPAAVVEGAGTVLVVDDEPDVRELAEAMLQRLGVTTLTAADGRAALELLGSRASEVDLVLLDLTMPGLGGLEVLEQIRQIRPELPVVLMSGYSERYSSSGCADHIAGFLQKPFSVEDLSERVRAALSPTT